MNYGSFGDLARYVLTFLIYEKVEYFQDILY